MLASRITRLALCTMAMLAAAASMAGPQIAQAHSAKPPVDHRPVGEEPGESKEAGIPPNPCRLMPAKKAARILGVRAVHEIEAPLGPTCILQLKGRKTPPTIVVEATGLAKKQLKRMKRVSRKKIGVHATYCGKLGSPVLYVRVGRGSTLSISAPCAEARALAKVAIPRAEI